MPSSARLRRIEIKVNSAPGGRRGSRWCKSTTVHGTLRTTSISVRNPRLLDLSAVLRLVPKKSSSAYWLALAALVLTHGGENLVPRAIERTIRCGASTACGQRPLSRASRPFVRSPLKGSSGSEAEIQTDPLLAVEPSSAASHTASTFASPTASTFAKPHGLDLREPHGLDLRAYAEPHTSFAGGLDPRRGMSRVARDRDACPRPRMARRSSLRAHGLDLRAASPFEPHIFRNPNVRMRRTGPCFCRSAARALLQARRLALDAIGGLLSLQTPRSAGVASNATARL